MQLVFLSKAMIQFCCTYPDIEIQLIERNSDELLKQLKQNAAIDLVFAHHGPQENLSLPENIACQPLMRENFCIVASSELGLSQHADQQAGYLHPVLDLQYIARLPLVHFQPHQKIRQITDYALDRAGIKPPPLISAHGFQNALEIASGGKGIVFLPEHYLDKPVTNQYSINIFSMNRALNAYWDLKAYYYHLANQPPALCEFLKFFFERCVHARTRSQS